MTPDQIATLRSDLAAVNAKLDGMEQGRREAREERAKQDDDIARALAALHDELAALREEVAAVRSSAITWKKLGAIIGGISAIVTLVAVALDHISLHGTG